MELPFELTERHKYFCIMNWRKGGLNCTNEEFEEIYQRYIFSTVCELCDTKYKSRNDRQMEHCHATGKFRNICCQSCNLKKRDMKIQKNNKSGYKYIYKQNSSNYKQGFRWFFQVFINGKNERPKSSVNLEKVIQFRDKWLIENNYNT